MRAPAIPHLFSIRSLRTWKMAREVNFLAHDNKRGADCLLNLAAACSLRPAGLVRAICWDNTPFQNSSNHGVRLTVRFILQDPYVHNESDEKLIELRIARAYVDLLCAPDSHPAVLAISIAWIDDHEIRLFADPRIEAEDAPLFWMELFDHAANRSINSYACRELPDAAQVFEQFRLEAMRSEAARRPTPTDPQG